MRVRFTRRDSAQRLKEAPVGLFFFLTSSCHLHSAKVYELPHFRF